MFCYALGSQILHIAATINALTLMIFVISVEFILLGILYLYMMFDPERHFICAYPFSDIFPRLDLGDGKDVDLKECRRSLLRQQCIRYLGPVC